jgi:tetratricopeptide (TPR) repeat protein
VLSAFYVFLANNHIGLFMTCRYNLVMSKHHDIMSPLPAYFKKCFVRQGTIIVASLILSAGLVVRTAAQSSFLPVPPPITSSDNMPTTRASAPRIHPPLQLEPEFEALAQAIDKQQAVKIEQRILKTWEANGKAVSRLLAQRATLALLQHKQPDIALEIMSRAINFQPDWTEGLMIRSLLFKSIRDYDMVMRDLKQVLALEPRHFIALKQIAELFEEKNLWVAAYRVYKRIEALHPQMTGLKDQLERLKPRVEGLTL